MGMVVLLILALLFVFGGALSLSNATAGVGVVAMGCFLAICARIAQAGTQHAALLRAVERASKTKEAQMPGSPAASTPSSEPGAAETSVRCANCGTVTTRGPAKCPICDASLKNAAPA